MSGDQAISAFAPGTVGNVICGFDALGLALDGPGDRVTVAPGIPGQVRLVRVDRDGGRLPREPERNSATVAIRALLRAVDAGDRGLDVSVEKGLPLSGGMGGSAASAAAAVVAADRFLEAGAAPEVLLACAGEGEGSSAGDLHLDNVAPALLGGLLLVRPGRARSVVRLPLPEGLSVALLHPRVEISTRAVREALGRTVPLRTAVAQWADTAAFVHGLHTEDWELVGDALVDRVAEPHRRHLIPGFGPVREAALDAGAVGCGISGAGPSLFSLCRSLTEARAVGAAMAEAFGRAARIQGDLHVCAVTPRGARIVSEAREATS